MKRAFKVQSHCGIATYNNVQQKVRYNRALLCDTLGTRIFGIMVIVCIHIRPSCPPRDPHLLIAEQQCVRPNAAQ